MKVWNLKVVHTPPHETMDQIQKTYIFIGLGFFYGFFSHFSKCFHTFFIEAFHWFFVYHFYCYHHTEGVFRAQRQREETEGAETILEGGETQVERPIDQEVAEEVEEEVEGEEAGVKTEGTVELPKVK